jgi:hypothetical protein
MAQTLQIRSWNTYESNPGRAALQRGIDAGKDVRKRGQDRPFAAECAVRRAILISLVILAANLLFAQQADTSSPSSKATGTPSGNGPPDAETMAAAIRNSYYHPDELAVLNCAVSINWPAFFAATKVNPPPERLKAIQGLSIQSHAVRGKSTSITFDWTGGALADKEQLENGIKQMLGGFYQMYWSLVASPPLHNASEISKIDHLSDGGAKIQTSSQNINVVITVDKENTPTHYAVNSPALSGTVDLRYVPPPKTIPGDVRRISAMDVSEQLGSSTLNLKLTFDYQAVGEFYVPAHISYDLGAGYAVSMEFSGCSASKGTIADKSGGS